MVTLFGLTYFSKKNCVWQVDLDLYFQGQISHFLKNLWTLISRKWFGIQVRIFTGFPLGLGSWGGENKFHYVVKVCPPGRKILNCGGTVISRLVSRFDVRFGQQEATTPAVYSKEKNWDLKKFGAGGFFQIFFFIITFTWII